MGPFVRTVLWVFLFCFYSDWFRFLLAVPCAILVSFFWFFFLKTQLPADSGWFVSLGTFSSKNPSSLLSVGFRSFGCNSGTALITREVREIKTSIQFTQKEVDDIKAQNETQSERSDSMQTDIMKTQTSHIRVTLRLVF